LSKENGITLITVPYWLDLSTDSLRSLISAVRPDLFPYERLAVNMPKLPTKFKRGQGHDYIPSSAVALGTENPTNWLVEVTGDNS
jgi:hypothetical protein